MAKSEKITDFSFDELFDFLEGKHDQYNNSDFIEGDPISIPHMYSKKEDIEIAGFFTATIAWGKRSMIIKNAQSLMELMDNSPYDFIINHKESDLKSFEKFVHRTFNSTDCLYHAVRNIYLNHNGLKNAFFDDSVNIDIKKSIINFNDVFFENDYPQRTRKHIANPTKKSAAKRINMFLRWMVRNDNRGVDFGIWNDIPVNKLICPLDVHSGNNGRKYHLLKRKYNDWQALHLS